jgi:hypothetical protein
VLFGCVAVYGPIASAYVFASFAASAYVFLLLLLANSSLATRLVSVKSLNTSRRSSSFVCS